MYPALTMSSKPLKQSASGRPAIDASPTASSSKRHLFCFDFDHTLAEANTDIWVYGVSPSNGRLPEHVLGSYVDGRCTLCAGSPDPARLDYMARIFRYLESLGVTEAALQAHMQSIPWVEGMLELLALLQAQPAADLACAVLSDSNTCFIRWILSAAGLAQLFPDILTNQASWQAGTVGSAAGGLHVSPYHSHTCSRCNHNLCKQEALRELIHKRHIAALAAGDTRAERVVYIGDGANDLCAAQALRPHDVIMPRMGYALDRILSARPASSSTGVALTDADNSSKCTATVAMAAANVKAQVVRWESGQDIEAWIRQNVLLQGSPSACS